jgi:hypothetical protein
MIDRLTRIIGHQILLRHIRHVIALIVLGEQVIKWLTLDGAAFLGNRLVPFFGIRKLWVHVKDHPAKGVFLVSNHLAQMIFCARSYHSNALPTPAVYLRQAQFVQSLQRI